jgi:hypothetical protein
VKIFAAGVEPVGVIAVGAAPTGVIAIGQLATGVVAIGQLARGFIAVGQLAVGVATFGQLAIGLTWASGQLALAPLSGAAMLPVSPFGRVHPLRRRSGGEWVRLRLPTTAIGWLGSLVMVVAVAALVSVLTIAPVIDALIEEGGIFRSLPGMR